MPKRKPDRKPEKRDEKALSKQRVDDLPVKDEQAAAVKGGAAKRDAMNHNETLVRA